MKRILLLSFILWNLTANIYPQRSALPENNPVFTGAVRDKREEFKKKLNDEIVRENLSAELKGENEKKWMGAFWGMELGLIRNELTSRAVKHALLSFRETSPEFQRAAVEAAYTLYPEKFPHEISAILMEATNPKIFAMAVNYLLGSSSNDKPDDYYLKLLKERFHNAEDNPILASLKYRLEHRNPSMQVKRPPLVDLFSSKEQKGKVIIYSLQRSDRNYPGLAVIKGSDGRFVRNPDGTIFSISQLARSITNMPGYLTNGNTPQGILSIQGLDTSDNVFIGPTPNIQLVLPYEVKPAAYFHDFHIMDTTWNKTMYSSLLPDSWKDYFPAFEAYSAGQTGRSEVISHGTTIDPEFYVGNSYYPNTPTLGCLCAKEIWSEKDGSCLLSDQAALVKAFQSAGKEGYFMVIELNDRKQPVTTDEIIMDILKAEENLRAE